MSEFLIILKMRDYCIMYFIVFSSAPSMYIRSNSQIVKYLKLNTDYIVESPIDAT
jgi:hypothetical protein